jgi:hypothetical protein
MILDEAKELLNRCERYELRDHAFGDTEIDWIIRGAKDPVAWGYFGAAGASVTICVGEKAYDFVREDAQALRKCGNEHISRNDETGPETYTEGVIMPGLTPNGVLRELTDEA